MTNPWPECTAIVSLSTQYTATFHGEASQVGRVRAELRAWLGDCPAADDVVLIASELSSNAVLHSRSAGEVFTIRAEVLPGCIRIECEDLGGPWLCRQQDGRPHGLDIVTALTADWGIETGGQVRTVWARVNLRTWMKVSFGD